MKVIANEGDIATGEIDVQDWRSLRKMQVSLLHSDFREFCKTNFIETEFDFRCLSSEYWYNINGTFFRLYVILCAIIVSLQSKRKPNVLMELVDDIEEYGKSAARMITKYNPVFQRPIMTENICKLFSIRFSRLISAAEA